MTTEARFKLALREMMQSKPLSEINVTALCDKLSCHRQTFYYHFHDVYDLVEWIFTQEAQKYLSDGIDAKNWREVISDLMEGLLEEKSFVMNAYYSLNRRQLEEFMQKLARPAISDLVRQVEGARIISEEDLEFVIDIATFSLVGIITEWVAGGMKPEYKEKLDRLFVLLDGTLEGMLDRVAKR